MEEKLVNGSPSDHLDDQCIQELMDACEEKNHTKFRQSLEALVMNMFEEEDSNAIDSGEEQGSIQS